jgi:ABC-type antimicrobial peptide transport system permease subunit
MERAWKTIDPIHPFKAEFFDDQIKQTYGEYKTMFRLFTFLALVAISISTMGLLGIAVFTTETRTKEISIRKVLGATEQNLLYLLSKNFMVMLLIAAIISVPLSYYLFDQLILSDFRDRISIGLVELLPGVIIILFIALLTVSWQTVKAAKTNPSDMLRSE